MRGGAVTPQPSFRRSARQPAAALHTALSRVHGGRAQAPARAAHAIKAWEWAANSCASICSRLGSSGSRVSAACSWM
eukprot:594788-Lingulodinium_polyedra.AAC.1